jgi:hypothetical protein
MTKEHSSYAKLMTSPDPTLQPERVLWLHVIAQALIDAASKDKEIRNETKTWLDTEDFEIVCGNAGMREEWVRDAINAILSQKKQKAAFKMAMSFRFLVRSFVDKHRGDVDKRGGLED